MSRIFKNAKPKLFGEPEDSIGIIDTPAVAGLSGDASIDAIDFSNFAYPESDGSYQNTTTETVIITTTINITKVKNIVIINIRIQGLSGSGTDWTLLKLRRGGLTGTILDSGQVNGTGEKFFNVVDINAPIDNTDYVITSQRAVDSHSVGTYSGGLPGIVLLSELDDTHQGIITTPATATKQINSPDSHRTRSSGIIS